MFFCSFQVCTAAKQDIVFIIDMSTSVGFDNFDKILEFLTDFLLHDDIDNGVVRVGVVGYSTDAIVEFHLNKYTTTAALYQGINSIKYMLGNTNTASGLRLMRTTMFTLEHGDRPDAENIAIIITDGVSNVNSRQTIPEARTARNSGIKIYAIGVALIETTELQGIASLPLEEHLFLADDFSELNSLKDKIFEGQCPQPAPTPTPTTQAPTTQAPTTPAPTTPPIGRIAPNTNNSTFCYGTRQDIVFILDMSTSVGSSNFNKVLEFLSTFLLHDDVDSGIVRVGVVGYSTDAEVEFYLDQYSTSDSLDKAIRNIRYRFGNTNTAAALNLARTTLFTADRGDRGDAQNIAIIVTDGVSNMNSRQTIPEAEMMRESGIQIYAIGVGLVETEELTGIASLPIEDHLFLTDDFSELNNLQDKVLDSFCPEPKATPTPTSTTTLSPTTTSLPTTPKPTTPEPYVCYGTRQDIVFILDMSTSVGSSNFNKVLDFLSTFLLHDDVDSGIVRVGVVGYSTDAEVEFYLDQYSTSDILDKAIRNIQYRFGNTNTAAALHLARTTLFTADRGDRGDAQNIAIIVTDGVSNMNSRQTIPEAEMMRESGIKIYAIGVGLVDTEELIGIASLPIEDHLFLTDDFSELNNLQDKVLDSFCPEPKTTPTPTTSTTVLPTTTPLPTTPKPTTSDPYGSISRLHWLRIDALLKQDFILTSHSLE
ncbi:cartilage matrix protein-like [Argopecten irradians]|uniref:cartilage matrix protein-like n=1 Tax=Argopecten irradians TaxID=31199 RepID=UPI003710BA25